MLKLKAKNPDIRIVPRLELQLGDVSSEQFHGLLLNPGFLIDQLIAHLRHYDGVVLDFGAYFHEQLLEQMFSFMH